MNTTLGYAGQGTVRSNLFAAGHVFLASTALATGLNAASINRSDVIVADSQATIYAVSAQTQARVIIAQQGYLNQPYDLARKTDGNLIVSDTGSQSIIQVNPSTGQQSLIAQGGALGVPYGLDVNAQNKIFVANSSAILCVAADTGVVQSFAQGGLLQVPLDVAVGPDGSLYVADAVAGIIRIDAVTRQQTLLAQGGFLHSPTGITTDGKRTAYVVDGTGHSLVTVDLQTGAQKQVSTAGLFVTPVGIALGSGGTTLVSDPDALNYNGAIIAVAQYGGQTLIAQGSGDLVNARGIVIVLAFVDSLLKAH